MKKLNKIILLYIILIGMMVGCTHQNTDGTSEGAVPVDSHAELQSAAIASGLSGGM